MTNMLKPTVVCLCGSTRFGEQYAKAAYIETLAGKIVLNIGVNTKSDEELFGNLSASEFRTLKIKLEVLHFCKIDLADEILVLNVGGYIGEATEREIEYAKVHGKIIRYLEN